MNINRLNIEQEAAAISLLSESNLPIEDFGSSDIILFGLFDSDGLIGCIGLEQFGELGLLRSLAVDKEFRGKGSGNELVKYLETHASSNGIMNLYLLTETAECFFNKLNYQRFDRSKAPEVLKASAEFSHICPESAVLMMKKL